MREYIIKLAIKNAIYFDMINVTFKCTIVYSNEKNNEKKKYIDARAMRPVVQHVRCTTVELISFIMSFIRWDLALRWLILQFVLCDSFVSWNNETAHRKYCILSQWYDYTSTGTIENLSGETNIYQCRHCQNTLFVCPVRKLLSTK